MTDAFAVRAVRWSGIEDDIEAVRAGTRAAASAQVRAAENTRALTRRLRDEGLSVTDIASLLGVSRGRVSQLMEDRVSA